MKFGCSAPPAGEAGELAERLRDEGIPVVHRWSAVLVGATDEASANQLAERLRSEAPSGCEVTVEGNLRAIYEDRPWYRFAVLGRPERRLTAAAFGLPHWTIGRK